jgi:serine/threonine protein kinase
MLKKRPLLEIFISFFFSNHSFSYNYYILLLVLRVHAVYDATHRDNTIATISEICTGSHLDSSIPYPEIRTKKIIAQILDALQYMHQRGLFHNSLNTENSTSFFRSLIF